MLRGLPGLRKARDSALGVADQQLVLGGRGERRRPRHRARPVGDDGDLREVAGDRHKEVEFFSELCYFIKS